MKQMGGDLENGHPDPVTQSDLAFSVLIPNTSLPVPSAGRVLCEWSALWRALTGMTDRRRRRREGTCARGSVHTGLICVREHHSVT